MYQSNTLYTLKFYNVTCQIYSRKKTVKTLSFSGVILLLQYISPTKGNVSWAILFNYRKGKKRHSSVDSVMCQTVIDFCCVFASCNEPRVLLLAKVTSFYVINYRILSYFLFKNYCSRNQQVPYYFFFGLVLRIYSFVIIHGNSFLRKKKACAYYYNTMHNTCTYLSAVIPTFNTLKQSWASP